MKRLERDNYEDMIDLPHPVSKTHPHMLVSDRAAQFMPFAALTGHGEAVNETARLTETRAELDESRKAVLDGKLKNIQGYLDREREPAVSITYFVPDDRKRGGAYITVTGSVKRIHEYKRSVILTDGTSIPIDEIVEIEEAERS